VVAYLLKFEPNWCADNAEEFAKLAVKADRAEGLVVLWSEMRTAE
jgi:hypothetical protein